MTGEEMERAIDFLLKSQATLEGQIAETNRVVQMLAVSQAEFNETLTRAVTELAAAQKQTGARVDRLAEAVERFIAEGRR